MGVAVEQLERLRRLRDGDAMADGDGRLYEPDREAIAAAIDGLSLHDLAQAVDQLATVMEEATRRGMASGETARIVEDYNRVSLECGQAKARAEVLEREVADLRKLVSAAAKTPATDAEATIRRVVDGVRAAGSQYASKAVYFYVKDDGRIELGTTVRGETATGEGLGLAAAATALLASVENALDEHRRAVAAATKAIEAKAKP